MKLYAGILDGADDVWGVWVPDYPGAHGGGATPQAAIADVLSAMADLTRLHRERGHAIPRPRDLDAVRADPDVAEALAAGDAMVILAFDETTDDGRPAAAAE